MGAVWLRSRTELRHRWTAWLAVALLAGHRCRASPWPRSRAAERVEHTYPDFVTGGKADRRAGPRCEPVRPRGGVDLTEVGRLPEVAETTDASAMLLFAGRTPGGRLIGPGDVFPVAAAGNALGTTFEKWTMLEGRPRSR